MQQAVDFLEECNSLADLLHPEDDAIFDRVTQFKGWTINDVIGHLHMFNVAASKALAGDQQFENFVSPVRKALAAGKSLLEPQNEWLNGLSGRPLFDDWFAQCQQTAERYATINPKQRITWVGPDMSARSSITARQMETWAHGQEVFDSLSATRKDHDRIKNIAHLGVNTFGWTFANRKLEPPQSPPRVALQAPSGEHWVWNEESENGAVEGTATEFCQIVTQTRNVKDTAVTTTGDAATFWMENAQCFAGKPVDPPAPGTRGPTRIDQ